MDEKTKEIIASNLTAAFYAGVERREPFFGEDKRPFPIEKLGDNRIPSLSLNEVFHVYSRFLSMLGDEGK